MSDKMNLYQKLSKLRNEAKCTKEGLNKHNGTKYYTIDSVYSEVKRLFDQYSIFTRFSLIWDNDIKMYRAELTVIDSDEPQSYFVEILESHDEGDKVSAEGLAKNILAASLADGFWDNLSTSHFRDAASLKDDAKRTEKLSIVTQFFLAEINTYCYVNGKSKANQMRKPLSGKPETSLLLSIQQTGPSYLWKIL